MAAVPHPWCSLKLPREWLLFSLTLGPFSLHRVCSSVFRVLMGNSLLHCLSFSLGKTFMKMCMSRRILSRLMLLMVSGSSRTILQRHYLKRKRKSGGVTEEWGWSLSPLFSLSSGITSKGWSGIWKWHLTNLRVQRLTWTVSSASPTSLGEVWQVTHLTTFIPLPHPRDGTLNDK